MKKIFLLTLCCLFALTPIMAQNGLAVDGWYEYTVSGGNLSELISEDLKYQITKLRLKGNINSTDLRLIRDMAGLGLRDEKTDGKLEYLDLNNAEVCGGGEAYRNATINYKNNELGEYMFCNSKTLKDVRLGKISKLGYSVFSGCESLISTDMPNVREIGSYCFFNCVSLVTISLPHLTKIPSCCFRNCSSLATVPVDTSKIENMSESCFEGCTSLVTVNFPNVTQLSGSAFRGCAKLTSISFEKGVQVGNYAFADCTSLKNVSLPKAETLSESCFEKCSSLETISLPNVTSVSKSCFSNCTSLVSVDMPNVTGTLGDGAFRNCSSLKSIFFPNVTELSNSVFYKCSNLESVNVDKVVKVGSSAFTSCKLLKQINLPKATTIGHHCFDGCISLISINLPCAESLEHAVFSNCTKLETANLEKVRTVGYEVFLSCESLKEVYMPCVVSIGQQCFSYCSSLTSISLPCAEDVANLAFNCCYNLTYVSLPRIKKVLSGTFPKSTSVGTPQLKSVKLDQVEYIENTAFQNCASLTELYIPNVKYIGNGAFEGSVSLTEIYIPEVEHIGNNAFKNAKIKNISLPNIQFIGYDAFMTSKAIVEIGEKLDTIRSSAFYNAEQITIAAKNVPTIDASTAPNGGYKDILYYGTVIVPAASHTMYQTAENWSKIATRIIPDNVQTHIEAQVEAQPSTSGLLKTVGEDALLSATHLTIKGSINGYDIMQMCNKMHNLHYLDMSEAIIVANPYEYYQGFHTEDHRITGYMFYEQDKLIEIKLPKNVTYIGEKVFYNCGNLKKAELYPGITTIDDAAFSNCVSLKKIEIPETVITINNEAFGYCTDLDSVVINEGLRVLGEGGYTGYGVFNNCRNLKYIKLPNTLEIINRGTFSSCSKLEEITLPSNVHTIGEGAFSCCPLKMVILPQKLTQIGKSAFAGASLSKVYISPMVETIGDGAFSNCSKLEDIYVYIANAKDIKINQNTFSTWTTSRLHVPNFAYDTYYWDTQWSQFAHLDEFDEKYESFYSKNTITLDKGTGTITGTPDATLHENGGLIVNDEEKQELDEIQLKSDGTNGATLIPENTGNIKAKKVDITIKVKGNKWHFFCFPFDVPLSGMAYEGEYVWRRYDGAKRSRREGGWQNLAAGTTTLEAGRGYIFQGTADGELTLSVENPEITASDVKTGLEVYPSDNSQDASWNFVGNPYVSYYSIDATTYSSPITIWNGTGYEAYRPGDDDYMFHPYQAFFVQTPVDATEIGFDATARESYEQSQTTLAAAKARRAARKMNVNRLLANLELFAAGDTAYMDKTRIVFNDKENMEYDAVSDAAKFLSSERAAEFYTLDSKNVQYAINERPMASGDVRMGFIANKAGEYRIAQSRSDLELLLVDHQEGITHNLGTGAYAFSSGAGTFDNRFILKVNGQETGITELKEKTGIDLTVDGELCINGAADEVETSVYQLNGVLAGTIQGNGNLRLPKGIYAVKVGLLTLKVQI